LIIFIFVTAKLQWCDKLTALLPACLSTPTDIGNLGEGLYSGVLERTTIGAENLHNFASWKIKIYVSVNQKKLNMQ